MWISYYIQKSRESKNQYSRNQRQNSSGNEILATETYKNLKCPSLLQHFHLWLQYKVLGHQLATSVQSAFSWRRSCKQLTLFPKQTYYLIRIQTEKGGEITISLYCWKTTTISYLPNTFSQELKFKLKAKTLLRSLRTMWKFLKSMVYLLDCTNTTTPSTIEK